MLNKLLFFMMYNNFFLPLAGLFIKSSQYQQYKIYLSPYFFRQINLPFVLYYKLTYISNNNPP